MQVLKVVARLRCYRNLEIGKHRHCCYCHSERRPLCHSERKRRIFQAMQKQDSSLALRMTEGVFAYDGLRKH